MNRRSLRNSIRRTFSLIKPQKSHETPDEISKPSLMRRKTMKLLSAIKSGSSKDTQKSTSVEIIREHTVNDSVNDISSTQQVSSSDKKNESKYKWRRQKETGKSKNVNCNQHKLISNPKPSTYPVEKKTIELIECISLKHSNQIHGKHKVKRSNHINASNHINDSNITLIQDEKICRIINIDAMIKKYRNSSNYSCESDAQIVVGQAEHMIQIKHPLESRINSLDFEALTRLPRNQSLSAGPSNVKSKQAMPATRTRRHTLFVETFGFLDMELQNLNPFIK